MRCKIGGTTVRGTARQRRPMLNRCELHDAPVRSACVQHRGVRFLCQRRHGEHGARPSMQGTATLPTPGGGLLGLGLTLRVQPQGGAPAAAVPAGDGEEARSLQSVHGPPVMRRTRAFRRAAIGRRSARASFRQALTR